MMHSIDLSYDHFHEQGKNVIKSSSDIPKTEKINVNNKIIKYFEYDRDNKEGNNKEDQRYRAQQIINDRRDYIRFMKQQKSINESQNIEKKFQGEEILEKDPKSNQLQQALQQFLKEKYPTTYNK